MCIYPCTADSCGNGQVCRDDSCVAGTCEDPEAPACPDMWECDPDSTRVQSPSSADEGVSDPVQRTEAERFIALGCVRKVCDTTDGFSCSSGWTCDPSDASSRGAGCVPTPCEELGRCSSGSYVCETTNDNPRPEGIDAHGCVRANCLEVETICGAEYEGGISAEYCDPTSERADDRGCVNRLCDELLEVEGLDACASNTDRFRCAPSAANADTRGCIDALCQTTVDYQCSAGGICDPLNDLAGTAGCVPSNASGQGGAAGSGPVTSSGGSPSGGSSSAAGGSQQGPGGAPPSPGSGGSVAVAPAPTGAGGSGPGVNPSAPPGGGGDEASGDPQGGSETTAANEPGPANGGAGAKGSATEAVSSDGSEALVGHCVAR
jgi:hypothetical protein